MTNTFFPPSSMINCHLENLTYVVDSEQIIFKALDGSALLKVKSGELYGLYIRPINHKETPKTPGLDKPSDLRLLKHQVIDALIEIDNIKNSLEDILNSVKVSLDKEQ